MHNCLIFIAQNRNRTCTSSRTPGFESRPKSSWGSKTELAILPSGNLVSHDEALDIIAQKTLQA